MRKITREELAQRSILKGKSSPLRMAIVGLQVGEILEVFRSDWNQKNSPVQMIQRVEESFGRKFGFYHLADKSGWIIERVK